MTNLLKKVMLSSLYGRFAKNTRLSLSDAMIDACKEGHHTRPIWTCKLDHDKRKRKVYGFESYCICARCGMQLDPISDLGTYFD